MPKINTLIINKWRSMCEAWLAGSPEAATCSSIITGGDAWFVAHAAGVVREAYAMGQDIHDAHIQTALQRIFPNVVFRDAKRY